MAENGQLKASLLDDAYDRIASGSADGFDRLAIIIHEEAVATRRDITERCGEGMSVREKAALGCCAALGGGGLGVAIVWLLRVLGAG